LPELVERLTLAGLEVGGVQPFGLPLPDDLALKPAEEQPVWSREHVLTAEVVRVDKHPQADKLKLVTLNYGQAEPKVVVTGAPNIAIGDHGQKVIVGLTGTVYRDGHSNPPKLSTLKPTQLRGVPSDAMVMSNFELGIADDHDGIIILEADAPVGVPLADYMGDVVLEVDVLPNMARCLAMLGVAREVAALTGQRIRMPKCDYPQGSESIMGQVAVTIADASLCPRYRAMLIRDVRVGPSPGWLQRRLLYTGMRPISNLVDVTNFVMLEFGQPLHAFDFDVLRQRAGGQAPTITIRSARAGETLKTLDGQDRKLTPEQLIIADTAGPIALAGVMGGAETEVTEQTKNVLLEAATFDPVSIRRTARMFDLHSEASARFSKGIHPAVVAPAAERACFLLQQLAGGQVLTGAVEAYPARLPEQVIDLPLAQIRRLLGVEIPADEAEQVLSSLEFAVERRGEVLRVTVPPFRVDIQAGAADLIEELARVRGYNRLPTTMLADPLPNATAASDLPTEERLRDRLAAAGLQEVITYSLINPERETVVTGTATDESSYVKLLNPVSSDLSVLRRTLLPGLLTVAEQNLKHAATVTLFELGRVYLARPEERLPEEPRRLGVVMIGRRALPSWDDVPGQPAAMLDFFDLKGTLETLLKDLHVPMPTARPVQPPHLHPGKAAEWLLGECVLGSFGQLHPKTAKAFGLAGREVYVAELDAEALLAAVPARYDTVPPPRFPAVLQDVAAIVPESVPADRVAAEIHAAGGKLLREARLFDVYRGPSIPAGTKSLAYALTYQSAERTLTDKEVEKAHAGIQDRLRKNLAALIRGEDVK
jgi:phenylalanyl-tRNA synthetase beta chain